MPKVNLLSLPRPSYRSLQKTYTDPEAPGVELALNLRALVDQHGNPDQFRIALALERTEAFVAKFAETGFPFPDGEAIEISRPLAETLCYLEVRQEGPTEERYTHEELLGLVRSMPSAYREIAADVEALDAPALPAKPDGAAEGESPNA